MAVVDGAKPSRRYEGMINRWADDGMHLPPPKILAATVPFALEGLFLGMRPFMSLNVLDSPGAGNMSVTRRLAQTPFNDRFGLT